MAQTEMEKHCEGIINGFHKFSIRVDHHDMLSIGELKQLLEQQLPTYLKKNKDAAKVLMDELDKDKNKQLDFAEFMGVITRVLIFSHDNIHKKEKEPGTVGHSHSHGPGQGHDHSHGH
ncbi:PREDICTED: protein S100-A12-like [Gekko japonicus]|uniref:Protein S100 n=1 Tax=Gekko japonicus TaxID=146911 RepID=A0ABM1JUJ1_GEKJA|nr:PREDICTED: protein S100-A12-like [Gekko japonicus]